MKRIIIFILLICLLFLLVKQVRALEGEEILKNSLVLNKGYEKLNFDVKGEISAAWNFANLKFKAVGKRESTTIDEKLTPQFKITKADLNIIWFLSVNREKSLQLTKRLIGSIFEIKKSFGKISDNFCFVLEEKEKYYFLYFLSRDLVDNYEKSGPEDFINFNSDFGEEIKKTVRDRKKAIKEAKEERINPARVFAGYFKVSKRTQNIEEVGVQSRDWYLKKVKVKWFKTKKGKIFPKTIKGKGHYIFPIELDIKLNNFRTQEKKPL